MLQKKHYFKIKVVPFLSPVGVYFCHLFLEHIKIFVTKDIAIVAGITGNLDCFPTLTKTEKENSTTYKFVESDFSRNSFYGSIGIEYKFAL
jgi:hypothetical protein